MTGKHGTEATYRQEIRTSGQACGHCLWAHNQYNKSRKRSVRKAREAQPKPTPVLIHGTPQAITFHARTTRPVCDICLAAACEWEYVQAIRYFRSLRSAA